MENIKLSKVDIKNHPDLNEKWLQECIAEDPSIMGLGDLILRDKERIQPRAGRLDLLFQDPDTDRRYEVELQLGRTDESHIIRCIEYWDLERKRYPQYDHCAVIIAEDITSRFLNVIALFNGTVPLIAIQVQAFKVGDKISLIFTTVMDELARGLDDEDEGLLSVDRAYWDKKASKSMMQLMDELLHMIHEFDSTIKLKYNKAHIAIEKNGMVFNFAYFAPKKNHINLVFKSSQSDEVEAIIESMEFDAHPYNRKWREYRLRLSAADIKKHGVVIKDFLKRAYDYKISWELLG